MRYFLQYHNVEKLGWVPFDARPFLQTQLSIATRKPVAQQSIGSTVFVIASLGTPRRYYLWERFRVEGVEKEGEDFCVWGTGRQLTPPARLEGDDFESFRKACAYFIGFRCIDDLPYAASLAALCRDDAPQLNDECERFCSWLIEALPDSPDAPYFRGAVRLGLGKPLDAVTDLAEAIRRGTEFLGESKACLRLAAERV
jgi:hypothetical protein